MASSSKKLGLNSLATISSALVDVLGVTDFLVRQPRTVFQIKQALLG